MAMANDIPATYPKDYSPYTDHSFVTSREYQYNIQKAAIREAGKAIVAAPGMKPKKGSKSRFVIAPEIPKYSIRLYKQIFTRVDLLRSSLQRLAELILSSDNDVKPPSSLLLANAKVTEDLQGSISFIRKWQRYKGFNSWLYEALICALWAGNSYSEVVLTKASEGRQKQGRPKSSDSWKIDELKLIAPDEMRPIRDSYGKVLGYIQYPFQGTYTWLDSGQADKFGAAGGVLFDPHEIIHIKIDTDPGEAYGTSKIEAVKDILALIIGMREDVGMIAKNYASPIILFRIGTELIPASPDTVNEFKANLESQMTVSSNIVSSTMVDPVVIATGQKAMNLQNYLTQFMGMFFGAMGIPEILLGQGQETTEATAKIQLEAVGNQIRVLQQHLKDHVELPIFARLAVDKRVDELTPGDMDKIPELWFAPLETLEDLRIRFENMFRFAGISRQEWRKAWGMKPEVEGDLTPEGDLSFQKALIQEQGKVQVKVAAARPAPGIPGQTPSKPKPTKKKSDRDKK